MSSSIKEFKKEINYIFGEVIDEANYKQLIKPEVEDSKVEAIIEEAIVAYEDFYNKINAGRKVENKKQYFKDLHAKYEENVKALIEKINAL